MGMGMATTSDISLLISNLGLSVFSVALLFLLALAFSSFIKIVTVLGIVRVGLGAEGLPSAFVVGTLSLALSLFVMFPTLNRSIGVLNGSLSAKGASTTSAEKAAGFSKVFEEWKTFLAKHTHSEEKERFAKIAVQLDKEAAAEDLSGSFRILAPAFLVSELKEAFATGLTLFLPFLVIDLLVANVLVAVGLTQLSPILVSLPFKLLVFVMVDGWTLITGNLVATYAG